MTVLAQAANDASESVTHDLTDNRVLEDFRIPFGKWVDQAVDWIVVNLEWLLAIIEWPFVYLNDILVEAILEPISWIWVVLFFFVIGTLIRNVQVGLFAAVSLTVCGLLGNNFWLETARTIGFIGVAVFLCVLIGIPLGVACGRVDAFWQVVRPVLDAMQVVHSFVYMLPFIYFWGIGTVSATMVTMVFALPPLIRLTNLGVRQVPADVVEASRAYGAPEWRVLFDVQIPLARPAIMTGINQTLLLAISMLGIAAIMGAGGLGRLLFNALSRQDVALGASAGLAFFLVAVVLDRISQTEASDKGSIFRRIRLAWAHRKDPEKLLVDETAEAPAESSESDNLEGAFAEVSQKERPWMLVSALGGVLAIVSVFLTWTIDAGFFSAHGRRADESLSGESFNGLAATGGSWFGYLTLAFGLMIVAAVATTRLAPGRGPRFFTTDGALISALALLVMMVCYLLASPVAGTSPGTGAGVYLALVGGLLATVGSLMWIRYAAHAPLHPLSLKIGWGRIIGGAIAALVIFIGAFSGWSFDERTDLVVTAETEAKIEELRQKAIENPADAGPIGAEISTLRAQLDITERKITDGVSGEGTRLGIWTLIAGLIGLATTLPASGLFGREEQRQWRWSTVTAGIGAGVAAAAFSWIFVQVRSADSNYVSGVGSFLTMIGGCMLAATALSVLSEFRRAKIYSDMDPSEESQSTSAADQPARKEQPVA
ncbi:MAG: ABC transporter permease subunit [Acidimicrobiaceae bacterium]|nr:ABC transporter permease subunit [Acidimicrobiaceae bacterium]MXW60345.1 ABC transporter permease subunit [Acidimicrobiaceae bacterium]MXW75815.1 ABC transporter permease subunit [Acidimicrobiaceae bacterium]MYA74526.1 ABC transporter permease subunit [Acidimicrobiaceae bacterium]MYC43134.1 ABC transporter permease subunit [Acidimicrobiaceae bacterium]